MPGAPTTPTLLCFDCAAAIGAVGLVQRGQVRAELSQDARTASAWLAAAIEQLRGSAPDAWNALEGVACGLGPGSFTGLRVGLALAKGLARGLGLPLVGFSSLAALAVTEGRPGELVCPVLDARKAEVYAALYRLPAAAPGASDQAGGPICDQLLAPGPYTPATLAARLAEHGDGQRLALVGPGHQLLAGAWERRPGQGPSVTAMYRLACEAWRDETRRSMPPAAVLPWYLRQSEAELARAARSQAAPA